MKAMILAAGYGSRLHPITNSLPKALVKVQGCPLVEYHLQRFAEYGFTEVVINVSYLAEQIKQFVGNGHAFGVHVEYSEEAQPLETGGGIFNALPLLGIEPFLTVNVDIFTDYPLAQLRNALTRTVHYVLAEAQQGEGDFGFDNDLLIDKKQGLTYTGIAVYSPTLFSHCQPGKFSVIPLVKQAIADKQVTGEIYRGQWYPVNTIAELNLINR